jgi:uncharacterized OsmC-like protein
VYDDDGVLVVRKIEITYRLRVDEGVDEDKVRRAFEHHPPRCPVYRSISAAVEFELSLELER